MGEERALGSLSSREWRRRRGCSLPGNSIITILTHPRVVAGGQAEKCGLVGQDKVMAINNKLKLKLKLNSR